MYFSEELSKWGNNTEKPEQNEQVFNNGSMNAAWAYPDEKTKNVILTMGGREFHFDHSVGTIRLAFREDRVTDQPVIDTDLMAELFGDIEEFLESVENNGNISDNTIVFGFTNAKMFKFVSRLGFTATDRDLRSIKKNAAPLSPLITYAHVGDIREAMASPEVNRAKEILQKRILRKSV